MVLLWFMRAGGMFCIKAFIHTRHLYGAAGVCARGKQKAWE